MSRFFCDTNGEMDLKAFKELNINLIKMPYTIDGDEYYYDLGENTDLPDFFNKMRKGAQVKTQALNAYDYIEYFEPVLKNGEDIIYVSFSHKMSGTFESMNQAIDQLKQKYPQRKILVADSKGISIAAGLVQYYAAKLYNNGAPDDEVIKFVEEFREKIGVYFTVDSLEYLKRGGRLSKFKYIFGTLLNIKPIITISDGSLYNSETVKGRKLVLKHFLSLLESGRVNTCYPIFVLHADCEGDAQILIEMIKEKYFGVEIKTQLVGPVIGCHCGPGTIGLAFVKQ